MAEAAIRFTGVNKWFGKLHVLRDITLAIAAGEVVVVCGPSGSGKSTLIRTVNGLERIQSGDVAVLGESIAARGVNLPALRTRVGMVFQSFNLFPHMTALENIMLAPRKVKKASRASVDMTSSTSLIISGSSAEVGSSNSMILGCMASARAMATRCCWPPERLAG